MTKTFYLMFLAACMAWSAHAATVAVTGLPSVNGADISNLVTPQSAGDILNGDRPAVGETFTTGSNAAGYSLNSLTFYQVRTVTTTGGTFNFRLGTVAGTVFTQTNTDSVTVAGNALSLSGSGNDWITFTLSTPITLAANTLYGVDLVRTGSGNFITWGENDNTNYAGGQSYTSGPNGTGSSSLSLQNNDRIFHLDIAAIPEPSAIALAGLGGLLLIRRRCR